MNRWIGRKNILNGYFGSLCIYRNKKGHGITTFSFAIGDGAAAPGAVDVPGGGGGGGPPPILQRTLPPEVLAARRQLLLDLHGGAADPAGVPGEAQQALPVHDV